MKKIRALALTLALTAVMLTFSGCAALDRAKENHAYYKDDERTVIVYKEKEYKLLPQCLDLSPQMDAYNPDRSLTEKDVPILAATFSGSGTFGLTKDGELMSIYNTNYFAREDVYDKYVEKIKNYKFTEHAVWTFKDVDGETVFELVTVKPEYIDVIKKVFETSQISDPGVNAAFEDDIEIVSTDSDHLFTHKEYDFLYSELGDSYVARTENGVLCYYKVAAEDMKTLKKFVKEYSNYYNYYTKAYYE